MFVEHESGVDSLRYWDRSGGYIPKCYGRGKKCKGGWRQCQNITNEHRAKIASLDAAGKFRKKGGSTTQDTGMVNTETGEKSNSRSDANVELDRLSTRKSSTL